MGHSCFLNCCAAGVRWLLAITVPPVGALAYQPVLELINGLSQLTLEGYD
jgi:hypothetical protein